MGQTKVTIEFTGRIEIPAQGWGDETKLEQIKKQARDEINHWQIMVKKGSTDPVPVTFIKMKVTEVILPLNEQEE